MVNRSIEYFGKRRTDRVKFVASKSQLKKLLSVKQTGGGDLTNDECQANIDSSIHTGEAWVTLTKLLQNIKGKNIATLIGSLKGRGDVVVKAQSVTAAVREYEIQKRLHHLPGFIKFDCFFKCEGEAEKLRSGSPLCTGVGNNMGIIVMPYYRYGSFEDKLKHNELAFNEVIKIMVKVILSLGYAYIQEGFTHGDMFTKNVLLGTKVAIIDFEKSSFDDSSSRFWLDLDDFINDVSRYLAKEQQVLLDDICRQTVTMARAFNKTPDKASIKDLVERLQALL